MAGKLPLYGVCALLSAATALWMAGLVPGGHNGVRLGAAWSSNEPAMSFQQGSAYQFLHLPHLSGNVITGPGTLQKKFLAAINADRKAAGLRPLRLAKSLTRAALAHSVDMARHSYMSHATPWGASPFDRLKAAGIVYREAGENIGFDQGSDPNAMVPEVETAMMHSPEHRANLLRPEFNRVGIGIAQIGGTLLVTEDFTQTK